MSVLTIKQWESHLQGMKDPDMRGVRRELCTIHIRRKQFRDLKPGAVQEQDLLIAKRYPRIEATMAERLLLETD